MPRVSNKQYLEQRHLIRVNWQQRKAAPFAQLSTNDQIYLWVYFAPTQDMSDKELIDFRRQISVLQPSLPQRAGRAFTRALPYLELTTRPSVELAERQQRRRKAKGSVVVKAGRRPEEETRRALARILLAMMDAKLKEQGKKGVDTSVLTI